MWLHIVFELAIAFVSLFLILLVLVQRGRGGGLAGALGGMGGQSAFGTRAGDTFTWITYATALVWIVLAALAIRVFTDPASERAAAKREQEEQALDETPAVESRPPPARTTPTDGAGDTERPAPTIGGDTPPTTDPAATDPAATDPEATDPADAPPPVVDPVDPRPEEAQAEETGEPRPDSDLDFDPTLFDDPPGEMPPGRADSEQQGSN
jgi:preprotein translocase subunit SecG